MTHRTNKKNMDYETILTKLDLLTEKIDEQKDQTGQKFADLMNEVQELKKSAEFLSAKYEEIKKKLDTSDRELSEVKSQNCELKNMVYDLQSSNKEACRAINDLDQYGRRECIEIKGIPYNKNECTDDLVISVARKLEVNISKHDISVCHRLGKPTEDYPDPVILAKFCSRRVRDAIFSNRSILHKEREIYINESLTKSNRTRFNACLKYKKANAFKYIWTRHGVTYLKKNDDERAMSIKNDEDLSRYNIFL